MKPTTYAMSAPPRLVESGPTYRDWFMNGIETTNPTTRAISALRPLGSSEKWTALLPSMSAPRERQSMMTMAAHGPIQ